MKKCIFSIGPVQGFIAEAKRTRDLWSGSFLLSYLSGCAMKGVKNAGGNIIDPSLTNNPLWNIITNNINNNNVNTIVGSLPNQFVVECDDNNVSKITQKFENEFNNAWKYISNRIWDRYINASQQKGKGTKDIWDRQVNTYWELSWVVVDANTKLDYEALKSRKNWRWREKPSEGGDHCTLMNGYQELSGYTKFKDNKKQKEFWDDIRKNNHITLDLDQDERLCSIAFIKRFFPNVFKEIININNDVEHWPSTLYLAAIPWLIKISAEDTKKSECDEYYKKVDEYSFSGTVGSEIPDKVGMNKSINIYKIEGNFFYADALSNKNATPLKEESKRSELISKLNELQEKCKPMPYFSMLLMDGDSMGKLKSKDPKKVSVCLSNFNKKVPDIVKKYKGVTIYAGGDDVLAMLPSNNAIECTTEIYKEFKRIFNTETINNATISAGLTISHYHYPLMSLYKESKRLLEEVAKEKNGRDSIAVSVIKPSGMYLQYVSKWNEIIDKFDKAIESSKYISNSALYSFRNVLKDISDDISEKNTVKLPKNGGNAIEIDDIEKILISKMLSNRKMKNNEEGSNNKNKKYAEYAKNVLSICNYNNQSLQLDGMFLAKFINQIKEVCK
ncbi:MAG: type III-B CRISPR-associated protein Cas10/Cmr2 [Thermoplasmata archaeon]